MISWKNKVVTKEFKELLQQRKSVLFFDVETSGLKAATDRIVQFSGVIARPDEFGFYKEEESIDLYIKQPVYMTSEVIDIHHITNEFLEDKPMEVEVVQQIYNFFNKADVISGYNIAKFDMSFIKQMFDRYGLILNAPKIVDVYAVTLEVLNRKDFENGMKLDILCPVFGIEANFHSAIDDVRATVKFLMALLIRDAFSKDSVESYSNVKKIHSLREYKKSKTVNRLYFSYETEEGLSGTAYYDRWNLSWEIKDGEPTVNLRQASELVEIEVDKSGKTVSNYKGN